MRLAICIPPSVFLPSDRVFPYLGPVQIATAARDIAGWDAHVLDLTGHALRCDRPFASGESESARGALVGAVSSQSFEDHTDPACVEEVWRNAEREIAAAPADVYGFYALSCQVHETMRLFSIVKQRWPKAKTILGGPHVAMAPDASAQLGFDCVVADLGGGGGGEAPFLRVLRRLSLGLDIPKIVRAKPGDAALHRWPWPDRRFIDIHSYDYRLKGEKTATVVTQRGCPYQCSFCSHTDFYRRMEYRDVDHVRAELRELREQYGYHAVMLYDDEVQIHDVHYQQLCRALREGEWTWRAFIKSNLFTPSQARLAAESGAAQLCTGGETMNADMKRLILKKSTIDDDTRFVHLCIENGIAPKVFTMVGLPGENRETAMELRDWLLARVEDGLVDFDCTVLTPYPGTPIYDALMRTGEYIAGPRHGLRLMRRPDFAGATVHYKGRSGEYVAMTETFDPSTGAVLSTSAELVALREEIDRDVRAAVVRKRSTSVVTNAAGEG